MKILVLVAMEKELSLLLNIMRNKEKKCISNLTYNEGVIADKEIVAAKCGIGKVNSAINTLRLIQIVKPDMVINTGVAGGVDGELKVGTVLIADEVAYHDVWCGPGTEYGAADGFPCKMKPSASLLSVAKELYKDREDVKFGLICSGDKFLHHKDEVVEIKRNFDDAKAVDMESASIMQTAISEGLPAAIIRVMSDTPGCGDNVSQYENFWDKAPEKTFECLVAIIDSLDHE